MSFRIEENGQFRGTVIFSNAELNDGAIDDKHVSAAADIAASKLEHQHRATYSQESDTTSAAEDHVIHVVVGATGTLKKFSAGGVTACTGNATITVDLHNGGASILTAAIALDSGDAAYAVVDATIATAAVVVDDVLEVVVTVDAGTGALGKGVFAALDLWEDVD
jgi:hypothetical protein